MRSNCNIWAWKQFMAGRTDKVVLLKTRFSKWEEVAAKRWWRWTLRPAGCLLGYIAWALVQVAWFSQWGRWAHVHTGKEEFIPIVDKSKRWVPPLIFRGQVRVVEEENH